MNSDGDNPEGLGCPIRISTDQCLLAAPHGFSQPTTSFIASMRQGIHQMPFSYLDRLNSRSTPPRTAANTATRTGKKPNSTQTRTLQSERQTNTHTPRRPGYSHHFLSTMSKNKSPPRLKVRNLCLSVRMNGPRLASTSPPTPRLRGHAYAQVARSGWPATRSPRGRRVVEPTGIEPVTSSLQS